MSIEPSESDIQRGQEIAQTEASLLPGCIAHALRARYNQGARDALNATHDYSTVSASAESEILLALGVE